MRDFVQRWREFLPGSRESVPCHREFVSRKHARCHTNRDRATLTLAYRTRKRLARTRMLALRRTMRRFVTSKRDLNTLNAAAATCNRMSDRRLRTTALRFRACCRRLRLDRTVDSRERVDLRFERRGVVRAECAVPIRPRLNPRGAREFACVAREIRVSCSTYQPREADFRRLAMVFDCAGLGIVHVFERSVGSYRTSIL